MTVVFVLIGAVSCLSSFISDIISPSNDAVWKTGDSVKISWNADTNTPVPFPENGITLQLVQKNRWFDKVLVVGSMEDSTKWKSTIERKSLLIQNYRVGLNEIGMEVPRFLIDPRVSNISVYLRWIYPRTLLPNYIYATSNVFTLVNSEYDESITKDNDIVRYVKAMVSPKTAQVFYPNETIQIHLVLSAPLPKEKTLSFCLVEASSKDKLKQDIDADDEDEDDVECIEQFNHRGPNVGKLQIWYTFPISLPSDKSYRFRIRMNKGGFFNRHKLLRIFITGKFMIANKLKPVEPFHFNSTDTIKQNQTDFLPFIYTPQEGNFTSTNKTKEGNFAGNGSIFDLK